MCSTFSEAKTIHAQGGHVIGTDEKTGIQALERLHATLPTRPGLTERREFEYRRHGTSAGVGVGVGEGVRVRVCRPAWARAWPPTSTWWLEQQLTAFIDYFNSVLAKPFRWTYAGRPLRAT